MGVTVTGGFNPLPFKEAIDRAAGRALIGIGMEGVRETKDLTHVISGTLKRSVHLAPIGYEGHDDYAEAASQELGGAGQDMQETGFLPEVTETPFGPAIELGSWLPYACVEWVGRGHPGITQGMERTRAVANEIIAQALAEEGL